MAETTKAHCCVAGGGPAGMMLGLLLARAGCEVVVLEKHPDFLRDFRGDTIHPSTLEVIGELGLLEEFLRRPHDEIRQISGQVGSERITLGDFSHVPARCKFVALMPQWDFLDFLAGEARRYTGFRLQMRAEAIGLMEEGDRVVGVRAQTPGGEREFRADLVVAADGRHSTLRREARLKSETLGSPIDVLWLRLPRKETDSGEIFGHIEPGRMLVMLNRRDYWQCAYVIPKGGIEAVKHQGLEAFRRELVHMTPFFADRVELVKSWDDVKLLTVTVDRLLRWWRPGLLCIGDAAHAMSPIGGVGINLAVQDAVAAGNLLARPLLAGALTDDHLKALQRRREFPTRATQALQLAAQNRIIGPALRRSGGELKVPLAFRLLNRFPVLRRIPARLIGMGFRPEHVDPGT